MLHKVTIHTSLATQMIDITFQIENIINQTKTVQGVVLVFCPHTTAAITISDKSRV